MDIYTYMYLIGTVLSFVVISYLTGYFRPSEEVFEGYIHVLLAAWVGIVLIGFAGTILYLFPQFRSEKRYAVAVFVATFLAGALVMGHLIKWGREAGERADSRADPWLKELN